MGQVLLVISISSVRAESPASLRRHIDLLFSFALQLGDEPFASSVAVNVGRVDEINAQLDRPPQRRQRFLIALRAPTSTNRPRAETDLRNVPANAAKFAIFHSLNFPYAKVPIRIINYRSRIITTCRVFPDGAGYNHQAIARLKMPESFPMHALAKFAAAEQIDIIRSFQFPTRRAVSIPENRCACEAGLHPTIINLRPHRLVCLKVKFSNTTFDTRFNPGGHESPLYRRNR